MHITMVGTGYVGLVSGTCLANTGNDVTCLDVDPRKIDQLCAGRCPIYEPGLEELITRNVKAGRLHFTTDRQQAYSQAQVIFICVGTPSDEDGFADLKYVLGAAKDIGQAIETGPIRDAAQPPVVVVKSTVPVGTNGRIRAVIAEQTGRPFLMASNPEFLKEGAAIIDFTRPDRVVIGTDDPRAAQVLTELHEPFVRQGNPILVMDIASAEMVKYAANAMLATKISFINEMANLCEAFDADVDQVRRGMCADKRIGNQFLYPGLGYGGSCFPKDVLACVAMGRHSGTATPLMRAVHDVNQRQRDLFVAKIEKRFGPDLAGKRFAVWGIAFKPGTDDIREAPSLTIMRQLLDRGATVAAHDPVAHETCRAVPDLGDRITYAPQPYDALDGADALVVCTDWDEFKHPDFEAIRSRLRHAVVFDGRNLYRPETMAKLGFEYVSIGRR
jgi:UDPglucose 6-dehydrogenase